MRLLETTDSYQEGTYPVRPDEKGGVLVATKVQKTQPREASPGSEEPAGVLLGVAPQEAGPVDRRETELALEPRQGPTVWEASEAMAETTQVLAAAGDLEAVAMGRSAATVLARGHPPAQVAAALCTVRRSQ